MKARKITKSASRGQRKCHKALRARWVRRTTKRLIREDFADLLPVRLRDTVHAWIGD